MAIFPPRGTGGGPNSGPGLNDATIYVSPTGDDSNDGLTWSAAVQTGYVGAQKLVAAGGGYLNIANETHWGGPVTGQGAWFRGDELEPTGWLPEVPMIMQGFGPSSTSQFAKAGSAVLYAGSNDDADYRTKPGVWLSRLGRQVVIKNIQIKPVPGHADGVDGTNQAFRIGWDYLRNEDGSVQSQTVSSSTRTSTGSGQTADGTTVHTCALLPAVTIDSAYRSGNITYITIARPGTVKHPPWKAGSKVWLQFSNVNFTSGAYTIVSCNAVVVADSDWSFTVSDVAADVGVQASPGTVRSNYVTAGDLIDLQSNLAQFPSTQYRVTATSVTNATTGTITVFDHYGGYNGVSNNSGPSSGTVAILAQVRGYDSCLGTVLDTCSSRVDHGANAYLKAGPMFDFGGTLAFNYQFKNCYMEEFYPTSTYYPGAPWDHDRSVGFLGYGDNISSFSGNAEDSDGITATYRTVVGQTFATFEIDGGVLNTGTADGEAPPPYIINGLSSGFIKLNNFTVSDAVAGFGTALATISGFPAVNIQGNCIFGYQAVGPANNAIYVSPASGAISPWNDLQIGTWADLRITGKHPASQRSVSPTFARYTNLTSPAVWSDAPTATGIADPGGGTGAVLWDDTAHASVFGKSGTNLLDDKVDTFFAAGGRYVVAGWFNYDGGNYDPDGLISWYSAGDLIWESTGLPYWTKQVPFRGEGWQFHVFSDKVVSGSAAQSYDIACWGCPVGSGDDARWFGLQAFWIPASVSDNDAAEFIGTLKAQPYYLQPGMAGTFEDQKFIAHGGVGVATGITKVVGGGSGQLTLTGAGTVYLPVYGADGTTILGWSALLQATVNP